MKIILLILSYVVVFQSFGQDLNVIGATGTQTQTSAYDVSYTIGEPIVNTGQLGNNETVTQGFHQSNITVSAMDEITASFNLNIFPNPTQNHIVIESMSLGQIESFRIFDSKGALVKEIPNMDVEKTEIDLRELHAGKYVLKALHNNNTSILSYQIIKLH